ncbi:MAG: GatB/YqeY domain-containing protein, partial [Vicinamibacteria bacterium]
MTTLLERITQDLTASMKAQDAPRTSALRMAKAALKNKEIDKRSALDDSEVAKVIQGLVKQREDSIEQFQKANRPELVAKEKAEIEVLRPYLPQEASDAEIESAVATALAETGASSPKDIGRVMKAALSLLQASGKPADGKKVNESVRRRLGS